MSLSIGDIQDAVPARRDEFHIRDSRVDKLFVFWDQRKHGLWTSPNCAQLPIKIEPFRQDDVVYLSEYSRYPWKTRWLVYNRIYLAFWPSVPEYNGIFECLNLVPGKLPIAASHCHGPYFLDPQRLRRWQELEHNLRRLGKGLIDRNIQLEAHDAGPIVDLPRSFGYDQYRATESQIAGLIYGTREAFIGLTAYVSYAIACDLYVRPHVDDMTPPAWLVYAKETLKIDPVWLNEVYRSFVCHFEAGFRPGMYMMANHSTWKETLPAFILAKVPLFICWGFRPAYLSPDNLLWRYRPCHAEAKKAIDEGNRDLPQEEDIRNRLNFWYNMITEEKFSETGSVGRKYHDEILFPFPSQPKLIDGLMPGAPRPSVAVHYGRSRTYQPASVIDSAPVASSSTSIPFHQPSTRRDDTPTPASPDSSTAHPQPVETLTSDPAAWLLEMASKREEMMRQEEESERVSREVDERQAARDNLNPDLDVPSVGLYMYVWQQDSMGNHYRRNIPFIQWAEAWKSYRPEDRHFFAFISEWVLIGDCQQIDMGDKPVEEGLKLNQKESGGQATVCPLTVEELVAASSLSEEEHRQNEEERRLLQAKPMHLLDSASDYGPSTDSEERERKRVRNHGRRVQKKQQKAEAKAALKKSLSQPQPQRPTSSPTIHRPAQSLPTETSRPSHTHTQPSSSERSPIQARLPPTNTALQTEQKATQQRPLAIQTSSRRTRPTTEPARTMRPVPRRPPSTKSQPPPLISQNSASFGTVVPHSTPANPLPPPSNVRDVVLRKWGLNITIPYVPDPRVTELEEGQVQLDDRVLFGRLGLSAGDMDDDTKRCLRDLFYNFFFREPRPQLFAPLWQLSPAFRDQVMGHHFFQYYRAGHDLHFIGVQDKAKPLFGQWYLVTLYRARAVVEVFRAGLTSIGQIVSYLASHGIPFHTSKLVRGNRHYEVTNHDLCTLGFFPWQHTFTASHWNAYQSAKDTLLRGPAGRAALLDGGIVGRIARDVVNINRIKKGMTSAARKIGEFDGYVLVDDQLTEAQRDVICGVYAVYTGAGNQASDTSWFPKHSVWKGTGANHDFWTVDNEQWYQRRLEDIQAGRARPMTSTEWRHELNHVRPAYVHKLEKFFDHYCDELLQGNTTYWDSHEQ